MANKIHEDAVAQRFEERTKNALPKKRVRSSVAEVRLEGRATFPVKQHITVEKENNAPMDKERNLIRACNGGLVPIEDKIRGLQAGGDGWGKNMKRKRSVGTMVTRIVDGDLKQGTQHRVSNEAHLRASNTASFRFTVREDSQTGSQNPLTKGRAARIPRTGFSAVMNSPSNLSQTYGSHDMSEQLPGLNKGHSVDVSINCKFPPTRSSSPPMTQWVGQRPQKISRTRRTNLVFSLPHHDEAPLQTKGSPVPGFATRLSSIDASGHLLSRGIPNKQLKNKQKNVPSPVISLETDESSNFGNKHKEKRNDITKSEDGALNAVQKATTAVLPTKKNKVPSKEDIRDGVQRQGRSERGSTQLKVGLPMIKGKMEKGETTKPLRTGRPGSERNVSRVGRPPSKKFSDRKAYNRPAHIASGGTPELDGESAEDHDELLVAANYACSSSKQACSSLFWKKVEAYFAAVGSDNIAYLKQQISSAEELEENLSELKDTNNKGELIHERTSQGPVSEQTNGDLTNIVQPSGHVGPTSSVVELCQVDVTSGKLIDEGWTGRFIPPSQRLLSAIITDDEYEVLDCSTKHWDPLPQFTTDCFHVANGSNCGVIDLDEHTKSESGLIASFQTERQFSKENPPYIGFMESNDFASPIANYSSSSNDLTQGNTFSPYSEIRIHPEPENNNLNSMLNVGSSFVPYDDEYEQMTFDERVMLELQSIGLCMDKAKNSDVLEDVEIDKDICELKAMCCQRVKKKKDLLCKIEKKVSNERVLQERNLEQVSMNKLVEMANRKFLVGRGDNGFGSKGGYKVPKQAAMGFAKRTLARCQKLKDTGQSCFSEPPFQDIILSAPLSACNTTAGIVAGSCQHDSQSSASGSMSNVVERHELLSKKIEKGSLNSFQAVQDQAFATGESVPKRGKKTVLVDDVAGNPLSRTTYVFGDNLPDGAKGKRTAVKAGRPLLGGTVKGERKAKSKSKLKNTQLSSSGHGLLGRPTETINDILSLSHKPGEAVNGGNSKVNNFADSQCNGGLDQDRTKKMEENIGYSHMILHADSVEDLGVSDELCGEGQDIGSWLMIDEDIGSELGVPDDLNGLAIPMDDLSDLNMNF